MKLGLVGVGNAGTRIVDRIRAHEKRSKRAFCGGNVLAFDTELPEESPAAIPDDQVVLLGDTHPEIRGEGVDGDADLAASLTEEEKFDVRRVFDVMDVHALQGFLVVAGLGGATGSGMGAVMIDQVRESFEMPVYALGVLPHADEDDAAAHNAARGLQSFVRKADNTILLDNDTWCSTEGDEPVDYEPVNEELATRVTAVLGAGERTDSRVAETAVDASDVMRTLEVGGVSSIGRASIDGDGTLRAWLYWLLRRQQDGIEPNDVKELVRRAVDSTLTLPCDVESADRSLVVLSGPPGKLSRRGFERARYWLEEETDTVEVLAGDEPRGRSADLTATVLLSNVTDVPAIEALKDRAVAFQR